MGADRRGIAMASLLDCKLVLPEPLTGLRPVRRERQRWQRLGRAEGELDVGYDTADRPVRVEYHWARYLSLANPALADVYTAELWVRQPGGDWLYLIRPSGQGFARVDHARVRQLFATQLGLDAGA
jgi:hypothetical protein